MGPEWGTDYIITNAKKRQYEAIHHYVDNRNHYSICAEL